MGAYAEEEDQTFDDFKDIGCCKLAVKNYFLHIFFVLLINNFKRFNFYKKKCVFQQEEIAFEISNKYIFR